MGVDVPQSDVLDLAIGLVLVWFVLSMLVSVVNEAFVLVFRVRAKHLWLAVGRLVRPTVAPYARRFLDAAILLPFSKLNHKGFDVRPIARRDSSDEPIKPIKPPEQSPLAVDLQAIYDALAPRLTDVAIAGRRAKLTSIASTDFAEAVSDLARNVHPADLVAAAKQLQWTGDAHDALVAALQPFDPEAALSVGQVVALAVDSKSEVDLRTLYAAAAEMFTARDIADFFAHNPNLAKAVGDAYDSLIGDSGISDRAKAAKATLAKWFDREMDQLSALYRRQNRKLLAVLAIPVVLFFQANAIGVVKALHDDASRRQALVANALATSQTSTIDEVVKNNCERAPSNTTTTTTAPNAPTTTVDPFDAAVERFACAGKLVSASDDFGLLPDWDKLRREHKNYWNYLFDDYGWLGRTLTVVALLFGAQFWFDILRRLVGIRKTLTTAGAASG